jgi:hypothetical protein
MAEKPKRTAMKAKWTMPESPEILKANAFRTVYTPYSIFFYVGMIDPEYMLPESRVSKEAVEIKTLGRYCLDKDDFIRLKTEIVKTYEGLKKMGALKNGE